MQTLTAIEAKNSFGQLVEAAQREPVTVTKHGRPAIVVLSATDYERRKQLAATQLHAVMAEVHQRSAGEGLTEAELTNLLSDD